MKEKEIKIYDVNVYTRDITDKRIQYSIGICTPTQTRIASGPWLLRFRC